MRSDTSIPRKANRVLNLILLAFLLILIRVWYLGFVQHEYHEQKARQPKRRSFVEKVERATIRDRFNIPLAQNKIGYNAFVRYADLREIPSHRWKRVEKGKKIKEPIRGPYIESLAAVLGKELSMDPQEIEDTIYAQASLFPHTPFIIKEGLSEEQYYRLRMLQKDWRGMEVQRVSQRVYPFHKVGCDIIGYMGAINPKEYFQIAEEIKTLKEYIKKRELGEIAFLPPGYVSPLEVRSRLKHLQERAYTINDQVGKAGIESVYDEMLRGVHGKKVCEIDPKGNILRELPGAKGGVSGQRVFLSISVEMQQYAEELLAQHEIFREAQDKDGNPMPGVPWIKGGAIVAMDPKTGEVLTLASYPRFDPNDFIPAQTTSIKKQKQASIHKWLENLTYVGRIWEGKEPLTKEIYWQNKKAWTEETQPFTWEYFLDTILSPKSSVKQSIIALDNVENAYLIQKHFELLKKVGEVQEPAALLQALYPGETHVTGAKKFPAEKLELIQNKWLSSAELVQPSIQFLNQFLQSIKYHTDKLLLLDLVRVLIFIEHWDENLVEKIGHVSLADFFSMSQALNRSHEKIRKVTEELHHSLGFKEWREHHFKDFLKEKRKEEKALKKPAKPYSEYLSKIEKSLFEQFWTVCKFIFVDAVIQKDQRVSTEGHPQLQQYLDKLLVFKDVAVEEDTEELRELLGSLEPTEALQCMKSMRSFEELSRPLYGRYRSLRNEKGVQLEKHLAASFYPSSGFGYGRSRAFRHSTPQGSIFKIAVGYEALRERYEYLKSNHLSLKDLNPLVVTDLIQMNCPKGSPKQLLGYTSDGEPIQRLYKGGMLPRTHPNIGKIDIVGAIEQSSNMYFSLLASEHIADPSYLEKATRDLGFGAKTGIDLPGEIRGVIPDDLAENKTGLYSFAIGQHSLIATPLQTAVMYSTFANRGTVLKPQILSLIAGKQRIEDPFSFESNISYPFQDALASVGINFPLFTESLSPSYNPLVHKVDPEVQRTLFFSKEMQNLLLQGMSKVILGAKGSARPGIIRYLRAFPKAYHEYSNLKEQLVGKTGTAEIFYKQWIDAESKAEIQNHIWFSGIVFSEGTDPKAGEWGDPELVIAVFLQHSLAGGKEAAPLAAQIATKWRELQKKYGAKSYLETVSSLEEKAFSEEILNH